MKALSSCLYSISLGSLPREKHAVLYKRSKPYLYEKGKTTQRKLLLFASITQKQLMFEAIEERFDQPRLLLPICSEMHFQVS